MIKDALFVLIATALLVLCFQTEAQDDNQPKINSGDSPVYASFE